MFVISISGAQATGKTTLARAVGRRLAAPVFSRDPLMSALRDAGYPDGTEEDLTRLAAAGYRLQGALIHQQLSLGQAAIVECIAYDAVRAAWARIAASHRSTFLRVDCVVSDPAVHQLRLDDREGSGQRGWRRIEWSEVEATLAMLPAPAAGTVVADGIEPIETNVERVVVALDRARVA